ncbi:MAG: glycosyltransferase [Verrucomicrobiales bacterium]|nr:glycosyltransferase [Verrucomicrobiales bacterium]
MTRYLRERALYPPLIPSPPADDLGIVVVIPAKDEPDLLTSLACLLACDPPTRPAEVIVVVNTSETDAPETVAQNTSQAQQATRWATAHSTPTLRFHILQQHALPKKHAGVGLARKIGMDEATRRLESVGNPGGIIACFDADSTCDTNYLSALEPCFQNDPKCQAASIYFEHPTSGNDHPPEIYHAITLYELHLRYFIHAQRHAGFPFAAQSIGSSMAVRCDAYQQQNGMNRRKAGEDFYFLHKFTPLGHVAELTATRVIPSPRRSHRVPFGTGKAVNDILATEDPFTTYNLNSFHDLKAFFDRIPELYTATSLPTGLPQSVATYLAKQPIEDRLSEIRNNSTSQATFRTRFFRYFDAFQIMKFVHHARDHHHPNTRITPTAATLLNAPENASPKALLESYRHQARAETRST